MYDLTQLKQLGRQRKRLMEQVEALRPELEAVIREAADAGVRQIDIIEMTGMSREVVRLAMMSEQARADERVKRRKKRVE